jgi:surfactin synthase thioesterase subunit
VKLVYFPCAGSFVNDSLCNELTVVVGEDNIIKISDYGNMSDEWNGLICGIVQKMKDTIKNEPYILIGCSMGAVVAYEVCKTIQQRKCLHMPLQIVVISSTPPNKMKVNIEKVTTYCIREIDKLYHSINLRMLNILKKKIRKDLELLNKYSYNQSDCEVCVDSHIIYSYEDELVSEIGSWNALLKKCEFTELEGGHFLMYTNLATIIELIKNDVEKYRNRKN